MAWFLGEISERGCLDNWASKSPENNLQTGGGGGSFRKNKEKEVPGIGLKYPLIAKRTGRWGGGAGAKDYAALREQCSPSSAPPVLPPAREESSLC